MSEPKLHIVANDNAPLRRQRAGKSFRQPHAAPLHRTANPISVTQSKAAAAWIIPCLATVCGVIAVVQKISIDRIMWPSFLLGGLLFLTALQSKPDSRLRNISGLLMIATSVTGLTSWLAQNGFALVAMELALLVAALALFSGWVFKSRPLVLLSSFSVLVYLAGHYPELGLMTGITDQISQLGAGVIPLIIVGQVVLAKSVQSSLVLFTGIFAGYVWLGTVATDIPLTALAGLGFAIASAQYWLGKGWSETHEFGADIHRLCAWIAGLGAALFVQSLWLSADSGQAKPFWPPNTTWWVVLGVAMFALFIACLMRYKTSHLSLSGIFIICLAVIIVPLAAAKPDWIFAVFEAVPGLEARPGFGLVIGAAIIAAGFIWLVGGLKTGRIMDMCIGALTIGAQSVILFHPDRFNTDLGIVFIVSLICALCIGGLVAGASPDGKQPIGHYA